MAGLTDFQYYENSGNMPNDANWGNYQYVLLKDIINNFYLMYVGDDKIINDCKRYEVVYHAKRGLQEINYDAGKEVKALELELPPNLQIMLPKDYVNYVRISWVDDNGRLRPLVTNTQSTIVKAYLQDNDYNILFDLNGDALEGTSITEIKSKETPSGPTINSYLGTCSNGCNGSCNGGCGVSGTYFGLNGGTANINGNFIIDKNSGVIRFSSDMQGRTIVIEYVSDGLSDLAEDEIKINKLLEKFIYQYIKHEILTNKFNIQEYIVTRAKQEYRASRNNAKIRLMNLRYNDLLQTLRNGNNWIK